MVTIQLTDEQFAKYKALHQETMDKLSETIGGSLNLHESKPVTHPQASCLVAHCIGNEIGMMQILNAGIVAA